MGSQNFFFSFFFNRDNTNLQSDKSNIKGKKLFKLILTKKVRKKKKNSKQASNLEEKADEKQLAKAIHIVIFFLFPWIKAHRFS